MHFPDQLTILQNKLSKPLSVRIKLWDFSPLKTALEAVIPLACLSLPWNMVRQVQEIYDASHMPQSEGSLSMRVTGLTYHPHIDTHAPCTDPTVLG